VTAGRYDLRIEQGTTYRLALTFNRDTGEVDEDDAPIFEPYLFAGADLRLEIRSEPGGTVLAEVSTVDGGIVIGDPGEIAVELTADQTAALSRARYDLRCAYPSGDVVRLLEGSVTVSPAITEAAA
jgi:hypothetical protein